MYLYICTKTHNAEELLKCPKVDHGLFVGFQNQNSLWYLRD